VEAFLRRDYNLADSIVDKAENMKLLENDIISSIDKERKKTQHTNNIEGTPVNVGLKLILEDIRRTAEHASDIAEAAMNQTIDESLERKQLSPSSIS
ncbi:MAG TPA: PhoU domain-containing protein, partial [Nitrososphaeraceae archaeon]|nr:PhoU domain-containing protein [Nitrososphaeraceae archaeon]